MFLWGCQKNIVENQLPDDKENYFKELQAFIDQRFFEYNNVSSINPNILEMDKDYSKDREVLKIKGELYSSFIKEIRQYYRDNKNIRKKIEKRAGYAMWDEIHELQMENSMLAIIPIANLNSDYLEAIIFVYKNSVNQKLKFHYVFRNHFKKYSIEKKYSKNNKLIFDRGFIISQFLYYDQVIFKNTDCALLAQYKDAIKNENSYLKGCEYKLTITEYYNVTEVWIGGDLAGTKTVFVRSEYDYEINCDSGAGAGAGIDYDVSGGGGSSGDSTVDLDPEILKPDEKPCPGAVSLESRIAPTAKGNPLASGTFGWTREDGTKFHAGHDVAGNIGDPIYAPFDGIVTDAYFGNDFGNCIWVESTVYGKRIRYVLAHCSATYGVKGAKVFAGDILGLIGETGNAEGVDFPHVHIAIQEWTGTSWSAYVDPLNYLSTKYDENWSPIPCSN